MLREAKALNRTELPKHFGASSNAVVEAVDALHQLASEHAWTFSSIVVPTLNPAHDVLFACFHKALLSVHCAHELTMDGLYGAARPHLRHAFESLMIAKYCSCDPDSDIFDRWIDGVDLYFTNGVLKKLSKPDTTQFQESWSLLCRWSHATVFASQLTLDIETTQKEAGVNLAFLGVLIEFLDHILCSHLLTPSVRYYEQRYGSGLVGAQARARLRHALEPLKAIRGTASKRLARDFRSTWALR